jgi:voltage-gated potassium channel
VNTPEGLGKILPFHYNNAMFPVRHNHPAKMAWDLIILATVLAFVFIITYKMVFHAFRADAVYYSLNFLFFLDLCAGFVTKVKNGHRRLDTLREIRAHYLRSWFTVDLLAFFPFELIPVAIFGGVPTDPTMFTIYLSLQSLTLIKLVKAVRIFQELTEAFGLSPAVKRLVSFGYWFSQAIHLMAMGWILIGASEAARAPFDQYLRSFYWVTTTIATIGYGDYYPNHDSNLQIVYTIVVEIFGVGMYTFVIANVSSLVANLDVARSAYQRHMEEVNSYLRAQKVPFELQERVRDYYSYLWEQKKSVTSRTVVEDLPPSLSLEILMHENRALVDKVEVFMGADEVFIREAVQRLRPRVFLPREYIVRQGEYGDSMYFLTLGDLDVLVDEHQVARLGPGSVFGEAALVTEDRRNASVRALTYGTGYQLSKHDFNELREKYPEFDERVKHIVDDRKKK